MWRSVLKFDGTQSKLFQRQDSIQVVDGSFTLHLNIDEVITLTTVSNGNKGQHSTPPSAKPFPIPYKEDFEKYNENDEPYNFAQQTGSFEVKDTGEGHGKVMRQMVTQTPIFWCSAEKLHLASNLIGSVKWTDITIKMDAKLGDVNSTNGYFVGARFEKGGCKIQDTRGVFLFIYPEKKTYTLTNTLARTSKLKFGSITNIYEKGWNTVSLNITGNTALGMVNNEVLFDFTSPLLTGHGFVGLGTASWGIADFDNVEIL